MHMTPHGPVDLWTNDTHTQPSDQGWAAGLVLTGLIGIPALIAFAVSVL